MSSTQKITLFLTLIVFSLVLSLPLIRSGLTYDYGIGFWGPSGHDMIWHLNLINHINNPLKIPLGSFSGEYLQNYHPFYDILIAFIAKITHISNSTLVFQIYPLVTSLIYLYLSFLIGKKLTQKFSGGIFLVFLNTFASSAGFLVTLIREGNFGGESLFWSMQSASIQINPPLVLSYLFILGLILKILNKKTDLLVIIFLVLLPITKAYGGVAGYLIWGFYSLIQLQKKQIKPLVYLIISLPLSYIVFRQYNFMSSGLIQFSPLWFIDQLFNSPDKLYFPRLSSALYNLKLAGNLKVIPIYIFGVGIFLFGNYFLRLFGFLPPYSSKSTFHKTLLLSSLILTILPLLFIQNGTAWNTIQFLYYGLLFGNILLVSFIFSDSFTIFKKILLFLILLLSVLGNINTYQNYLGNPPPSAIPAKEIEALNFLNQQPAGTVLTVPYDPHLKDFFPQTPVPLYAYITSAYIPAFTRQTTFISDEMNLNNSGYDWQNRLNQSLKFFKQENVFQDRGFLVNNKIDYVYLAGIQKDRTFLDLQNMSLVPIFENDGAAIYRVNR